MKPGEIITDDKKITINANHLRTTVKVKNTGDRPIQVGSHFHFYESNKALSFNRAASYGKHLDIPAGASVRFEPGDEKEIYLIEFRGNKKIYGFRNLVDGPIDASKVMKPDSNSEGE